MTLQVIKFPEHFAALDIPAALRVLADEIEAGDHGDAHALLWVVDAGDGLIDLGLLGRCADLGGTAMILACAAQKKIMSGIGE